MATPIPQNEARFTLAEVLEATSGTWTPGASALSASANSSTPVSPSASQLEQAFSGVATDTREQLQGKIFVALSGERFDAHRFLALALQKGAALLVLKSSAREEFPEILDEISQSQLGVVWVEDTLVALGDLAALHRRRWGKQLVAICGAAGKTTTRSVMSALFASVYGEAVLSTRGNLNNRIGVPMTLLGLLPTHQAAILELGTNQKGEIAELCRISQPDVGVLTLIDLEHTEGLVDLDGVEAEEGALFQALPQEGLAVGYGEDLRVLRQLKQSRAKQCVYGQELPAGTSELSQVAIVRRQLLRPELSKIEFQLPDAQRLAIETTLLGKPGALALAAALSVGAHLFVDQLNEEQLARVFFGVGEPGRSVPIALGQGRYVLDDSYNSNPASVPLSIESAEALAQLTGGRLFLVLGEMRELGSLSESEHRALGRKVRSSSATAAYWIAGDAKYAAEELRESQVSTQFFESSAEVVEPLVAALQPSDVVLVKASRGVRAELVVQGLVSRLADGESK